MTSWVTRLLRKIDRREVQAKKNLEEIDRFILETVEPKEGRPN